MYQSLFQLRMALKNAIGGPEIGQPLGYLGGTLVPPDPSVGTLADTVKAQLEADRLSGSHPNPASPGWMAGPDPSNPALATAQALLAQIREAVDM